MVFETPNIDRAIVMTQYDLRGFAHPGGGRMRRAESAKCLHATTSNFLAFASGAPREGGSHPDCGIAFFLGATFEEYLSRCEDLAGVCDLSQKEAIQLIVREIVAQSREMKAKIAAGEMEESKYLYPLNTDNHWGRAVIALATAFEVADVLDQVESAPVASGA